MSVTFDLKAFITSLKRPLSNRCVILCDTSGLVPVSVYGHFEYPYDQNYDLYSVNELFDTSFDILKTTHEQVYTIHNLPIIAYVGRYTNTLLTKDKTGIVVCSDVDNNFTMSHMGLE